MYIISCVFSEMEIFQSRIQYLWRNPTSKILKFTLHVVQSTTSTLGSPHGRHVRFGVIIPHSRASTFLTERRSRTSSDWSYATSPRLTEMTFTFCPIHWCHLRSLRKPIIVAWWRRIIIGINQKWFFLTMCITYFCSPKLMRDIDENRCRRCPDFNER